MNLSPAELMKAYLVEVAGNGRLELIEELTQPDMIDEINQAFGGPTGREGLVAHAKGFRKNIGNLDITINKIVAGENEVMAWWSFSGTHDGPWLGRKPTGDEVTGNVFSFFDLIDGRVSRYKLWMCAEFDEPVIVDSAKALRAARK